MRCYLLSAYHGAHTFVSRCLTGVLNGNIGVMKSMLVDITDPTNIAQGNRSTTHDLNADCWPFVARRLTNTHCMVIRIGDRVSLCLVTFDSIWYLLSPLIGGTLANPHQRLRGFQGAFWEKYPYFLPCCVSAAYAAFAFLVVSAFLKEVSEEQLFTWTFPLNYI